MGTIIMKKWHAYCASLYVNMQVYTRTKSDRQIAQTPIIFLYALTHNTKVTCHCYYNNHYNNGEYFQITAIIVISLYIYSW